MSDKPNELQCENTCIYISIEMLVDFYIKNLSYLEETTGKISTKQRMVIVINSYNNNVQYNLNINNVHKSSS